MKIILLTQGSQGLLALRELFANNIKMDDISVYVCNETSSNMLIEFLKFNNMDYEHSTNGEINLPSNTDRHILLSIGWKFKVDEQILKRVKLAVNLHPGYLPDYKGCFSTPWSIINNEKFCGYTFHIMDDNFDTGDIIYREKIPIHYSDNAWNLNYKIINQSTQKIGKILDQIKTNQIKLIKNEGGQYYSNKIPYGGEININWSEEKKRNFIRALYFPPHEGAFLIQNNQKIFLDLE